ncbi:pyrroline-5-carboxylate reductase [Fluoribacter dumoffii]|uniref:Pyrroline-5-carboxylate reductase n=1 Tax=Fluoribacter dumoffii TaxID=463 RepID=A0A377G7P8_9GAMM|nr:pyrroline-5-carboxylate reductase [Fluoribacter dumoffii]KTC89733.1 pyrroline-5-carboxylate reductase [Fluoribacter dumoffii NY 23]MCW8384928.1 pyrroline-5-carboxylate reductase [Fluoribacter dumoffii]MCW8417989.1 pyrroline-5-carboxylate reductase [Fluoribacter dumoffii]MCW8454169.1 pyrroline-5-carboxylate reductase [Fluoribacter dumoffii]MCW8461757.1 pyrroline-5-carboxylate reductase [Fluoribacter dumoffii]
MTKSKTISIIGAGHLGSALARGLIKNGYPAGSITFSNRDPKKSERLVKELGVLSANNNIQAAMDAEILILAVKPQYMQDVCLEIASALQKHRPLIISLAGVIDIASMMHWFTQSELEIVRVMTNTPTEFCKGTSALFASASVSAENRLWVETLFNGVGYTFWVEQESLIDTLTAPIGCAPAYVFLFLEALQKAAISRGIPEELSGTIALESVIGAAELAKQSGRSFDQLRAGVSTPNGVTAHSLESMSFNDFFALFKQIFAAAEERIEQITQSLGKQ